MCLLRVSYDLCLFFFFKQKTAYEMRISDWSSDVCSSDLTIPGNPSLTARAGAYVGFTADDGATVRMRVGISFVSVEKARANLHAENPSWDFDAVRAAARPTASPFDTARVWPKGERSEEHTSELQSLMRTSYAVFFLNKKYTVCILPHQHTTKNQI